VPGDQRDDRVEPVGALRVLEPGGGELDLPAVGAPGHADGRVEPVAFRAVLADHLVDHDPLAGRVVDGLDRTVAAEEADQLGGRGPVVLPVVERDRAGIAVDEPDAGVGERHVAVLAEALGEVGLVLLRAAEAVGGQQRRRPVALGHPGGDVEIGVDLAGPVLGPETGDGDREVPGDDAGRTGRRGHRDRPPGGQHGGEQDGGGASHWVAPRRRQAVRAAAGSARGPME
jgi:hypothetical protein